MTRRFKRDGTGSAELRQTFDHAQLAIYTKATLPNPSGNLTGRLAYISDPVSNQNVVYCDGAAWRYQSGTAV